MIFSTNLLQNHHIKHKWVNKSRLKYNFHLLNLVSSISWNLFKYFLLWKVLKIAYHASLIGHFSKIEIFQAKRTLMSSITVPLPTCSKFSMTFPMSKQCQYPFSHNPWVHQKVCNFYNIRIYERERRRSIVVDDFL